MSDDLLKDYLSQLKLSTISNILEAETEKAIKKKLSYSEYLKRLLEEEVLRRTERSIQRKISKARFSQLKTVEMFDFAFQPQIEEKHIKELSHLAFIERAENVIFLGPP